MTAIALAASAAAPLHAEVPGTSWDATVNRQASASDATHARQLRAALTLDDHTAVLEAVQFALDQVGDGATYVWHRKDGELHGAVQPTTSFRDVKGQVCRHIVLALTIADYTRQIEGIACRSTDKRWLLTG